MLVGGFDFDAACRKHNALAKPLSRNYGDAIHLPWRGKVWCNPPYSHIEPWVSAAFQGAADCCVLLIPSPNGEERYRLLCEKAYEISIIGRIGFLNKAGKEVKGNPRGSSLFIIGGGFARGKRIVMDREDIRNWRYR